MTEDIRIGTGFDVHALVSDRPLILGGVNIPWSLGLAGHSDADVLMHAICDACLGAFGRGDIGRHFPPGDPAYKDIDSRILLREVAAMLRNDGYLVSNLDCTIIAEQPKLAPFIGQMEENVSADLGIDGGRVNIKATTTEGLGFTGRGEGIAAQASVLISGAASSSD